MAAWDDSQLPFQPQGFVAETMDSGTSDNAIQNLYKSLLDFPGQVLNDDALYSPFDSSSSNRLDDSPAATTINPGNYQSAESSPPDSSSDSSARHKRNISSNSSTSGALGGDLCMTADPQGSARKVNPQMPKIESTAHYISTSPTVEADIDTSNRVMEQDFDFDSAASGPQPAQESNAVLDKPIRALKMPFREPSEPHFAPGLGGKGETSASAPDVMSWSPASDLLNQSVIQPFVNGNHLNGFGQSEALSPVAAHMTVGDFGNAPTTMFHPPVTRPPLSFQLRDDDFSNVPISYPKFLLYTPLEKSRVETQITIKLLLSPLPPGVTKLHLPTYTISKPKLQAKPTPKTSPDMWELQVMLVCTSAVQDPEGLKRALARAAAHASNVKDEEASDDSRSTDEGEIKALDGGPVVICSNCIAREFKRADRKTKKDPEEQARWRKDEARRIVIFNCNEIKDFERPVRPKPGTKIIDPFTVVFGNEKPSKEVLENGVTVDLPMRIACYCRHQEEKLGFQVIFTIKDHQDRMMAQGMTKPIMITDDHKNTEKPDCTADSQNPRFSEYPQFPGAGVFPKESYTNLAPGPFRQAFSATELQGLQRLYNPQMMQPPNHFGPPQRHSQHSSSSTTPYILSRAASPSAPSGPNSKRRKTSGSGKVPDHLTMTPVPNSHLLSDHNLGAMSAGGSYVPAYGGFPPSIDNPNHTPWDDRGQYAPIPTGNNQHFDLASSNTYWSTTNNNYYNTYPAAPNTNPATPNHPDDSSLSLSQRTRSMDDVSALQSSPSTVSTVRPTRLQHQNHPSTLPQTHAQTFAQIIAGTQNSNHVSPRNTPHSLAITPNQPADEVVSLPQPILQEVYPGEGPVSGGIRIAVIGTGLYAGLEVMFGNSLASTNFLANSGCMIITLPASACEGIVPVTFRHDYEHPSPAKHQRPVSFRYHNDNKLQVMELALSILSHKYAGTKENGEQVARNLLSNLQPLVDSSGNTSDNSQGSFINAAITGSTDLETMLMSCLDIVDLADTPFKAQLNSQRPNGQSMLHFSASLGYLRLVAGLLARGADPDLRDENGFTPMHMATLNGHLRIVKKLRSAGGDPMLRSLRGAIPADMTHSLEVSEAASSFEQHTRSRSAGATLVSQPDWNGGTIASMSAGELRPSRSNLIDLPTRFRGRSDPMDFRDDSVSGSLEILATSLPPAYEEIYPQDTQSSQRDLDIKKATSILAVGEALIDQKCAVNFDHAQVGTSSSIAIVKIGADTPAMKVKRLRSDRKLFFFWIPLLIFIVIAMLKDWAPQFSHVARQAFTYFRDHFVDQQVAAR